MALLISSVLLVWCGSTLFQFLLPLLQNLGLFNFVLWQISFPWPSLWKHAHVQHQISFIKFTMKYALFARSFGILDVTIIFYLVNVREVRTKRKTGLHTWIVYICWVLISHFVLTGWCWQLIGQAVAEEEGWDQAVVGLVCFERHLELALMILVFSW